MKRILLFLSMIFLMAAPLAAAAEGFEYDRGLALVKEISYERYRNLVANLKSSDFAQEPAMQVLLGHLCSPIVSSCERNLCIMYCFSSIVSYDYNAFSALYSRFIKADPRSFEGVPMIIDEDSLYVRLEEKIREGELQYTDLNVFSKIMPYLKEEMALVFHASFFEYRSRRIEAAEELEFKAGLALVKAMSFQQYRSLVANLKSSDLAQEPAMQILLGHLFPSIYMRDLCIMYCFASIESYDEGVFSKLYTRLWGADPSCFQGTRIIVDEDSLFQHLVGLVIDGELQYTDLNVFRKIMPYLKEEI